MFGFQKLDAYRCATEFLATATRLSDAAPRGYASLSEQLRRAALSIPLNIAEGSGKFNRDARRFYAIARGSALECAAIVDALEVVGVDVEREVAKARELLVRIVSMLTVMLRE
jgi:four helix bundle protein